MTQVGTTSSVRGRLLGISLACLYVAAGYLGIALISLPPGNLTLVWLCSGIGLATFQLLGMQAAGWVAAASFAVNCPFLVRCGRYELETALLLGAAVTCVNVAQSWGAWRAAAWLQRKHRRPLLSSSADAGGFLMHVCVVPAVSTCWFLVIAPELVAGASVDFVLHGSRIVEVSMAHVLGFLTVGPLAWSTIRAPYAACPKLRLAIGLMPIMPVAISFVGMPQVVFLSVPAIIFASSRLSLRDAWLSSIGLVSLEAWGTSRGYGFFARAGGSESLFDLVTVLVCVLFAELYLVLLAIDRCTDQVRLQQEITDKTRALGEVQQMSRRMLAIQEEERTRIGRELHDGLGQVLAGIAFRLRALRSAAPADLVSELATTGEHLERAIDEARRMSHSLHPALLDNLGIEAACRAVCRELEDTTGVTVRFECSLRETLPQHVQSALYRVLQEALQNVEKHAEASTVLVALRVSSARTQLRVDDDGKGFCGDPSVAGGRPRLGLGLRNMKDRARALGGECSIVSEMGAGTRLELTIPMSTGNGGAGVGYAAARPRRVPKLLRLKIRSNSRR